MAVHANHGELPIFMTKNSGQIGKKLKEIDEFGYPDIVATLGTDHRLYIPPKRYTQTQDDPLTWVRSDSLAKLPPKMSIDNDKKPTPHETPKKNTRHSNGTSNSESTFHPNFEAEFSVIAKRTYGRNSDVDDIEILLKAIGSAEPKIVMTSSGKLDSYLKSFTKSMFIEHKAEVDSKIVKSQEKEVKIIEDETQNNIRNLDEEKQLTFEGTCPVDNQVTQNIIIEAVENNAQKQNNITDNLEINLAKITIDNCDNSPRVALYQSDAHFDEANNPILSAEYPNKTVSSSSFNKSSDKQIIIPKSNEIDLEVQDHSVETEIRSPTPSLFHYHKISRQSSRRFRDLPPPPKLSPIIHTSPFVISKEAHEVRVKVKPDTLKEIVSDDRPISKKRPTIEPKKMFLMLSKELRRKF